MATSAIWLSLYTHHSRPACARNSACADVALIWLVEIRGNVQNLAVNTVSWNWARADYGIWCLCNLLLLYLVSWCTWI